MDREEEARVVLAGSVEELRVLNQTPGSRMRKGKEREEKATRSRKC